MSRRRIENRRQNCVTQQEILAGYGGTGNTPKLELGSGRSSRSGWQFVSDLAMGSGPHFCISKFRKPTRALLNEFCGYTPITCPQPLTGLQHVVKLSRWRIKDVTCIVLRHWGYLPAMV